MAIYGVLYGDVAGGKVSVHASAEIIREEIKKWQRKCDSCFLSIKEIIVHGRPAAHISGGFLCKRNLFLSLSFFSVSCLYRLAKVLKAKQIKAS